MKTLIGIMTITCLLVINGQAQSLTPTKVHFLNAMVGMSAELKTTLNPDKPLRIKPRNWVVIQPVGDSLGFIVDNKPYVLHFEPNKQYYFIIQISHYSHPLVTAKSEQEFILTATAESVKGPEEYKLSKTAN